ARTTRDRPRWSWRRWPAGPWAPGSRSPWPGRGVCWPGTRSRSSWPSPNGWGGVGPAAGSRGGSTPRWPGGRGGGPPRGPRAAAFHDAVARGAGRAAAAAAASAGVRTVALGGGVFQNARLLVTVERELRASGLVPLRPLQLGPNDGAVSYGQAAVAAARLAAG